MLPYTEKPSLQNELPQTSSLRQEESTADTSLDQDPQLVEKVLTAYNDPQRDVPTEETVLYLAYGSNMASATFNGKRGVKPISQINVYVPELRLSFDLPGIPYLEPCFAATQYRASKTEHGDEDENENISEKAPLFQHVESVYHKDRWQKPLVGVVYEVTTTEYATIIATEGGGRGYKDIIVDCYPFPDSYNPADPVPDHPTTKPFKAHSLLSPATNNHQGRAAQHALSQNQTLSVGPGTSYAQPSARYLKLLTTGAAEHNLPLSYQEYLAQIRPYRMTTPRQRIGKYIFVGFWGPIVLWELKMSKFLAKQDGHSPAWLDTFAYMVHVGMWGSYDWVFRRIFGDGERTIEDTLDNKEPML